MRHKIKSLFTGRIFFFSALFFWAFFFRVIWGVDGQSSFIQTMQAQSLPSQSLPPQSTVPWSLPRGSGLKETGPRTYRFTVDYTTMTAKGEMLLRQHLTADYTRGLAGGDVVWKNVQESEATGATAPYAAARKREFMEGFHYQNNAADTMKLGFFKGFPATAVLERNLVWDTVMIESFGQNFFDHLSLNEPYHVPSKEDVKMPDVGTFQNRDIVLDWIGRSLRNGQECAVIQYQAFFNPLEIINSGMTLNGRSSYWGEIWVSLATRQIEAATINESVVGELKLASQDEAQVVNVFRTGTFEPTREK